MRTLSIELKKEKRTGIIPLLMLVGLIGAFYVLLNFYFRKASLLSLPLKPMDILMTQLYGVIVILNMFGIVIATCIIYNLEFKGKAIRKMQLLPISLPAMYSSKFVILTIMLAVATILQNLALIKIGIFDLPLGAFDLSVLIKFAIYSFLTSMPVLSFEILVSSRCENMWIPLGVGVAGFLTGMALATSSNKVFLIDPFVLMLRPAVAMSSMPEISVIVMAGVETILFLILGIWISRKKWSE